MTSNTQGTTSTATFASVRVITDDVPRLVAFYELVTDRAARWATPAFAELVSDRGTLAVAGTATLALFADGIAEPAAHPLLDATIDVVLERHRDLLRRGAVLVDPTDPGTEPRVLVMLEHTITDARSTREGSARIASRRMAFVELSTPQ